MTKVAVLGAGIVGIAIAHELVEAGFDVTLIDRDQPGIGCSYGNAGLIQCGAVLPIANPEVVKALPSMLFDKNQPLMIKWRYLPSLAPYLLGFLAQSTRKNFNRNAKVLADVIPKSWSDWEPLLARVNARELIEKTGELHVYKDKASFDAAQAGWEFRRRLGVEVQELHGDALHDQEPGLNPSFHHAAFLPESYQVLDPFELSQKILVRYVSLGGRVVRNTVKSVVQTPQGVHITMTGDVLVSDCAVLALGAFSNAILKKIGVSVPLNSERGYHVKLARTNRTPRHTILSGDWRFAISPMNNEVRLAGTAELSRIGAPPDYRRADRLVKLAQYLLPELGEDTGERWMGHRPSLPDSLPVLGRIPNAPRILCAFGHGHSGLSLAATTARITTDILLEKSTRADTSAFRIDRF